MKKYLAMAAAALALVACDKNNDDLGIDNTKDTPITIQTAGVAELMTRTTTTPLEGTAEKPVSIGVFVTDGSLPQYTATNVQCTHNGTAWKAKRTMLYEGANSTQQIYAYYPFVESTTGTITVNAADQIDYLVATTADLTSSSVSLTMGHALTKLVLEATMGTEVAGEEVVYASIEEMYPSGTWKVSDNSWNDLSEDNATLEMKNNEVLVIPMEDCSRFPINVKTTSGRVFKASIALQEVGNVLLPGTQYTIKLKVGQDKVELGGITAAPWGNPVDGGLLETL